MLRSERKVSAATPGKYMITKGELQLLRVAHTQWSTQRRSDGVVAASSGKKSSREKDGSACRREAC